MAHSVTCVANRVTRAWHCDHFQALVVQSLDETTLFSIRVHLGTVNLFRRSNCLAVWFEDPASLFKVWDQGNILFGSLTALRTICGRNAPKLHFRVLCVCCDVDHVWSSTWLKVAVFTLLEVRWVISVTMTRGRLVLPEITRFLGPMSIVLEWVLLLDKWANLFYSKWLLYLLSMDSVIWFILVTSLFQVFNLFEPLILRACMPMHGLGKSFW